MLVLLLQVEMVYLLTVVTIYRYGREWFCQWTWILRTKISL